MIIQAQITITWENYTAQTFKRNCHCSIIWNDKLFILGGYDGEGIVADALVFDLIDKVWDKIPLKQGDSTASSARYAHKAILVQNEIFIFGGYVEKLGWLNDLCSITLKTDVKVFLLADILKKRLMIFY